MHYTVLSSSSTPTKHTLSFALHLPANCVCSHITSKIPFQTEPQLPTSINDERPIKRGFCSWVTFINNASNVLLSVYVLLTFIFISLGISLHTLERKNKSWQCIWVNMQMYIFLHSAALKGAISQKFPDYWNKTKEARRASPLGLNRYCNASPSFEFDEWSQAATGQSINWQ